jgi:hypothetical protein
VTAVGAALALDDREELQRLLELIEGIPKGKVPQYLHAHAARVRAQLGSRRGDDEPAEAGFKRASGAFRELGIPLWIGATLLEYGEWLSGRGRGDEAEPLLAEARGIFAELGAAPWLERLDAEAPSATDVVVAGR